LILVDILWDRLDKNTNMSDLSKFKIKFEKDGGFDLLESIQINSQNIEVANQCGKIVEKYFELEDTIQQQPEDSQI